jgi:hypothetical protein
MTPDERARAVDSANAVKRSRVVAEAAGTTDDPPDVHRRDEHEWKYHDGTLPVGLNLVSSPLCRGVVGHLQVWHRASYFTSQSCFALFFAVLVYSSQLK